MDIVFATNFFRYGKPYNPPAPLQKSGGNYKKLLLKSPFGKGGFRGIYSPQNRKNFVANAISDDVQALQDNSPGRLEGSNRKNLKNR
jgi:hypothetical protein